MSRLDNLIADHIQDLSGAEFKLAVYLYRRLQRRAEITTTIHILAEATGLSWRQTQSALQSLAKQGILQVDGRRKRGTRCSLPVVGDRKDTKKDSIRSNTRPSGVGRSAKPPRAPLAKTPGKAKAQTPEPALPPPVTAKPEAPAAPLPPSPQQIKHTAKLEGAQRLVCELMETRRLLITPEDFNLLLQCADGEIDRLLARLQKLIRQQSRFDNFRRLCADVRSMVFVR